MVDGSGYYHQRKCGFASQLGVELDLPTIGVCKSYLKLEGLEAILFSDSRDKLLVDASGDVLGAAVVTTSTKDTKKPLYISIGHRFSLEIAIKVVKGTCKYKIPEPIRQADLISRGIVKTISTNTPYISK